MLGLVAFASYRLSIETGSFTSDKRIPPVDEPSMQLGGVEKDVVLSDIHGGLVDFTNRSSASSTFDNQFSHGDFPAVKLRDFEQGAVISYIRAGLLDTINQGLAPWTRHYKHWTVQDIALGNKPWRAVCGRVGHAVIAKGAMYIAFDPGNKLYNRGWRRAARTRTVLGMLNMLMKRHLLPDVIMLLNTCDGYEQPHISHTDTHAQVLTGVCVRNDVGNASKAQEQETRIVIA